MPMAAPAPQQIQTAMIPQVIQTAAGQQIVMQQVQIAQHQIAQPQSAHWALEFGQIGFVVGLVLPMAFVQSDIQFVHSETKFSLH